MPTTRRRPPPRHPAESSSELPIGGFGARGDGGPWQSSPSQSVCTCGVFVSYPDARVVDVYEAVVRVVRAQRGARREEDVSARRRLIPISSDMEVRGRRC